MAQLVIKRLALNRVRSPLLQEVALRNSELTLFHLLVLGRGVGLGCICLYRLEHNKPAEQPAQHASLHTA